MNDRILVLTSEQIALILEATIDPANQLCKVGVKIGPPVEVYVEYIQDGVVKTEKR